MSLRFILHFSLGKSDNYRNKMRGRPKIFDAPRLLAVSVETDWHARLQDMLAERKKQHPRARMSDLLRAIIERAIAEHLVSQTDREREQAKHRRELRRLATACAGAADDKVELHARKLAALVE
jgi:hypothetical protein